MMTTADMLRKDSPAAPAADVIPYHKWTHDCGKVRILKCVDANRKGYKGFQWPESGPVKAETWSEEPTCESGGLFGWAWGLAFGDGKDPDYQTNLWIVFEADPADVILIEGGKVKAIRDSANVIFCGRLGDAMSRFILAGQIAWAFHASSGAASNSGYRGAASNSGYRGIACSTGEEATIEISGLNSLGATTADKFQWVLHAGAMLCQRTEKGCWLLKAEDFGADGETVTIEHGVKLDAAARIG